MDVTDADFESAVVERSTEVPVVVDLWAPWCQPCKTLGPIIEKVVAGTEGRVALAKVDIDQNPRVRATFQVQSIPAVFALKDRKIVDQFIGAVPEAQVQAFVDKLAPKPTEADELVAAGDEVSLRRALELQPDHVDGVMALAELLIARGDRDEALRLLERIPETAEVRRIAALARVGDPQAGSGGEGEGSIEERLDALLERVKDDESARQEFVDLLEVLGPDDPRTPQYRKALTTRLF